VSLEIHGFCDPRFAPLKAAFAANFEAGHELGASLALTHHGRLVVDVWAGWADAVQTRPWEADTLVRVSSTTKVASALCALMLVDRGLIELDAPVARYWPRFAQGGKAVVTIRDALTHQAGVPGFAQPVTTEQLCDWDYITGRIAAEPHWFGGERRVCYHSFTFGFELGQALRQVDGRMPSQFFREEIARPLSLDFHLSVTDRSLLTRVAEVSLPPPQPAPTGDDTGSIVHRSVEMGPDFGSMMQSAEVPAAGGTANGRSIAQLMAVLAMRGAVEGHRFIAPALADAAATRQAYGVCPYLGSGAAFGLGVGLNSDDFKYPTSSTCGWGGYGGSWALADPATGVSFGYAPNNFDVWGFQTDPRLDRLGEALKRVSAELPRQGAPSSGAPTSVR
jgi:CubicO group peptidase (beta-lactamase class C family)